MPITPFHFGPGFLIKSVFSRWFSFRVFILANIITDFEPLYFMLTNQWPWHRFTHTYLGATLVAIVCIVIGRLVCHWSTDIWNKIFKSFKINNTPITVPALVAGAVTGTYSHVLLDSIMHPDMYPFYPWTLSNGMLYVLSLWHLHLFCVLAGVVGFVIYWTKRWKRGRR